MDAASSPAVRDYVDTMFLELAHWGDELGGSEVQTVFFGGGTPSLLSPRIIGLTMERISKYFKLASKAEVTLEANPESLRGGHRAAQYLDAGINRLSIGVQSMPAPPSLVALPPMPRMNLRAPASSAERMSCPVP